MNLPVTIAVVAAVVGPLLTYLAAARRLSGRIATSEAASLWAESAAMRQDYLARITQLNATVERCQARVQELENYVDKLREMNGTLRDQLKGAGS
jgi:predicted RNase H-like nuclease (RuvC/YqgF family)